MALTIEAFERYWFKIAITGLLAIVGWFSSQVFTSLQEIRVQFAAMDKRVTTIETSGSIYREQWIKEMNRIEVHTKIIIELETKLANLEEKLRRNKIY